MKNTVPGAHSVRPVEVAQTNLRLYQQLLERRWSDDALARAAKAYELAVRLFSGQVRPSGKTFVAHLVGTASFVAQEDDREELVLAALLHAAYSCGEFGDGSRGPRADKRELVRGVVGPRAEELIHAHATSRWTPSSIDALCKRAGSLSPAERDSALLRLANELDDRVDLAMLYCDRPSVGTHGPACAARMAELARQLGWPALAGGLEHSLDAEPSADVPLVLRRARDSSELVAPLSHRARPKASLRLLARRFRRSLFDALRRA